jgi:4-amino-4-deoxy-L-arabinose transferase-like glycosyltransferase
MVNLTSINTPSFFFNKKIVDIIFVIFCLILVLYYAIYISGIHLPSHDGGVYLLNARSWLYGTEIDEKFRPPLLSWIISGIWALTGENWIIAKYIQSAFTIAAGIILYLLLRKFKGSSFALGVSVLTMLNAIVFAHSTKILTEGLALFFLVTTLYLLKVQKKNYWFFAGITLGLTFASRYPIAIQVLTIFFIESVICRKLHLIVRTILGAVPTIAIVVIAVYLKTGAFQTALAQDTVLSIFLSPFYLWNAIDIWGFAFLLLPIAFLYKRTYKDKFNYVFIAWFIVSFVFWSANLTNHQYRFAFQFTPAVYYLSMLGIENFLYYLRNKNGRSNSKLSVSN